MRLLLSMCKAVPMDDTSPPLSLLVLAAVAEQAGHSVRIVLPIDGETLFSAPRAALEDIDVVGLSVNSFNWFATRRLIEVIHGCRPALPIVIGGPHATHLAEHCLRTTTVRVAVRGEGERTLPELLAAFERGAPLGDVHGITFRDDSGTIVATPDRPLLAESELDAMPLPAYHLVPPGRYGYIPMETARGCHYRCIFCALPFPRRYRSYSIRRTERTMALLAGLKDRFTLGGVFLSDDSFSADKEHAEAVLRLFAAERDLMVGCEARIDEIRRNELLGAFARARVFVLQVGVECGYAEGLRLIRKGIKLRDVMEFALLVRGAPFRSQVYWSFIIGFPWEAEREVLRTINFAFDVAARSGSQQPQVNSFSPYPGSELGDDPERYGLERSGAGRYDTADWFQHFIGYTRIPEANRRYIHQYLHQRHYGHPVLATPERIPLPDGTIVDDRVLR